tara:strand:+ start:5346 stop:6236 length:891 start_codon:yes stop_codon:yes gene_type:complete
MTKATHNGTCQVCGRTHARKAKGLAKHGYTVEYGFFNGTCDGSDELPVEESVEILDRTVVWLNRSASRIEALQVSDIDFVDIEVKNPQFQAIWCSGIAGKRTITARANRADWEAHRAEKLVRTSEAWRWERRTWEEAQEDELLKQQRQARAMRDHVAFLLRLKESRHGQPLLPRSTAQERTQAAQERTQARADARAAKLEEARQKEAQRLESQAINRSDIPFAERKRVNGRVPMTKKEWADQAKVEQMFCGWAPRRGRGAKGLINLGKADMFEFSKCSNDFQPIVFVSDAREILRQ